MKCKVFREQIQNLEDVINEWLEDDETKINKIHEMNTDSGTDVVVCVILYS